MPPSTPPKPGLSPPATPQVGDMYWVDTAACYGSDAKSLRPVVVVRAPNPPLLTDAVVVTRTSDTARPEKGVLHRAVPGTTLDRDGKFMKKFRTTIDARMFAMASYTSYIGRLDEDSLAAVLEMMGLS